mmetsp:Transcript_23490/g.41977  ORF Transcript_23490/g.41977 Transcript_23490/m.41977 type:complete len:281 (+) Transcript_23490:213-1055(+)
MLDRSLLSRIIFPIPRASYTEDDFPEELIWIPKTKPGRNASEPQDEETIPCLLMKCPSARYMIIYFHSNAEVHVLAVEYPGYGLCPGVPCGESVMENAVSALHFATDSLNWPLDSIKVFGRSIGTGPAVGLAGMYSLAGLILVSPFLSIQELFRDRIGHLAGIFEDVFVSKETALKIDCPTLIIHGQSDAIISCSHGQQLYKLLKSRKLLVTPPDVGHNSSLLVNLQYLILPMFHLFALPDYQFKDSLFRAASVLSPAACLSSRCSNLPRCEGCDFYMLF